MSGEDVLIGVLIHSAWNLPKLDLIGSIDPYVKLRFGGRCWQTKILDTTTAPVWNEAFFLRGVREPSPSVNPLVFEVWDRDSIGSDELAALGELPLGTYQDKTLDLHLAPGVKGASSGAPALKLWGGYVLDYPTLCARVSRVPGAICDGVRRRILVPAPDLGEGFYVGVEYQEGDERISLLMISTTPREGGVAHSINWSDRHGLTLLHRSFPAPQPFSGLGVRQLWQVSGVPVYDRFSTVMFERADVKTELECTLWEMARAYGWREEIGYEEAVKTLRGVKLIPNDRSVYLPLEDFYLALHWSGEQLMWRLLIHDTFKNRNALFDVHCQRPIKVVQERYRHACTLGETPLMGHIELEGVTGISDDLSFVVSQRRYLSQWRLTDLLPLHG